MATVLEQQMQTNSRRVFGFGLVLTLLVAAVAAPLAAAQPTTVFHGRPGLKISEGGMERVPTMLNEAIGATLEVVITEENGRYFWASRQNTEMGAVSNSAFTTFIALNGSGYVRVKSENIAETGFRVTPTEQRFDYVEHIPLGLNSVIYYGNRLEPEPPLATAAPTPR
ncbi:MAG: hypothetical protein QF681_05040 [Vicinamibacterales bacterium]|nr:hypothetical protein [Vicinamibacterales bacterium]